MQNIKIRQLIVNRWFSFCLTIYSHRNSSNNRSNKNNTQFSTFWHANSRYLRLQEVSVNYNLAAGKLLKYLGVRSLDLQFVASDLCIWSPMKLWDAEQADHNGGAYPIPQRFAFQMYVNF